MAHFEIDGDQAVLRVDRWELAAIGDAVQVAAEDPRMGAFIDRLSECLDAATYALPPEPCVCGSLHHPEDDCG
ncbi:hypothetical protein AB0O82_10650 [Kitasatospora sp. NPDC088264]|uniref:hypothetical protein n=1 Tax=Kitasatospora sp. NPDC088264 TaxID=3155296 RepID=UPI00341CB4CE